MNQLNLVLVLLFASTGAWPCWIDSAVSAEKNVLPSTVYGTPEATLREYIEAIRVGDFERIANCFDPPAYGLVGPTNTESNAETYRIRRRIIYGAKEVKEMNRGAPLIPAALGDVPLEVDRVFDGSLSRFWYLMRRIKNEWKIITFA